MDKLDTSPRKYFPSVYDEILEIDEISNAEDNIFRDALSHLDKLWKNSFVHTCDADGVAHYENVLGITLVPNEEQGLTAEEYLAFRKTRVINRLASIPSYTMPWLRGRLSELLGPYPEKWFYTIDFAKRELVVNIPESSGIWAHEVSVTINQVKPANLVFVSRPIQEFKILVGETVSKSVRTNNYKLGSWKLGNGPFSQFSDAEVAKMASANSIQPSLLGKLATFTAADVKSVLINDKHSITDFILKSASNGTVSIEYEVFASAGLGEITNIKLLDALNVPLANITVSIDNTFNVRLHHNIEIMEGVNAETT